MKNRSKIIISVVVFLAVCGIVAGFSMKYFNNDSKTVKVYTDDNSTENLNMVSDKLLKFISRNTLYSLDSYNDINYAAIDYYCIKLKECQEVKKSEVEEFTKRVFNKVVEPKTLKCLYYDEPLYIYKDRIFRFNEKHVEHDGLNLTPIYTKVDDIKKEGNNYVLTVNKLYFNPAQNDYVTDSPMGTVKVLDYNDDVEEIIQKYNDNYSEYRNIGIKYQYVFAPKGNTFYLVDYKRIGN